MIVCNGAQKTGTHLLTRAVALFGNPSIHHTHTPYADKAEYFGKLINIRRCPRNSVISYLRHFEYLPNDCISEDDIIRIIPTILKEHYGYTGWITHDNGINVTFEKLLTDESELQRIAEYLGTPLIENHFRKMWGGTATFTGNLSNWRDHWTDRIREVYKDHGGETLENLYGYYPDTEKPYVRTADAL